MAKRINLREFQQQVFARLREVSAAGDVAVAKLGVQVGSHFFLIDMRDVSEVVPVPRLLEVQLVKSWFAGVANIRGNLFSVTDLQDYLGLGRTQLLPSNRLLLLHARWMSNASLLVTSMLGLRYVEKFERIDLAVDAPAGAAAAYRDAEGRTWYELNLGALVQNPEYLNVALV
jgi:twitching motility protein PilI